ncbi:MAG: DUF4921 family protein [Candidatus Pacebacteria bacterium]|nr:DUF4921 family protein [Candidatus Paceibacterota bacterium]
MDKKSELRRDLVSGDWIVISESRSKRKHQFAKKEKRIIVPRSSCPFEDPQRSGNKLPILIYPEIGKWRVQVLENKYPAFKDVKGCAYIFKKGPYSVAEAVGHHDLVLTRDHNKRFDQLPLAEAELVFRAFKDRYEMHLNDPCVSYVSIFHNWGPKAGASIYHPHYQMIAIPVVPPDVEHSLDGSVRFFEKNKKCVHCVMIKEEIKEKNRIVFQNKNAVAFAPFVSKEPFELRIFPKKHIPYFEETSEAVLKDVIKALYFSLKKIAKNMKDPDLNFFIHTAPIKNKKKYHHYHWHIEVIPKTNIDAGFELSTGIEINTVDPDEAAKILKKN